MLRTALVHDWLTGLRGGEKVLDLLCELLPQSDLYTMVCNPGRATPRIEDRRVVTSWLDRIPGIKRYYRYALPLMPSAARSLKLRGYDLVVAVSTCIAHGVDVDPDTRFICYCNTPMRYAWNTLAHYVPKTLRQRIEHAGLRVLSPFLRQWDRRASRRVGEYIANSRNIRDRVRECYGRDAAVIYPPVDTDFYTPVDGAPGDFYLWVGTLVPYKRIDLAVEAFRKLGRKLVVIGEGQDLAWARRNAPSNVTFLGRQPDDVLRRYYSSCRALVFPGVEDFGIVPVEAQACGRPVIAYDEGGALETILGLGQIDTQDGPTGIFFQEPTADSLAEAVLRYERNEDRFKTGTIRSHALHFTRERCRTALRNVLFGEPGGLTRCLEPTHPHAA